MSKRVAVVMGTRPEIIKTAEIVQLLGDRALVVHTGQHWEDTMSGAFMSQLGMPTPDVNLSIGGTTRTQQIAHVMLGLERAFTAERPAAVVVQGDTNSVVGAALLANTMAIPLVHVEAGLRSFDRLMPEEHNRVVTDHLPDLCLAPTEQNRSLLEAEGISRNRIVVTGNTVVAAVTRALHAGRARDRSLATLGVTAGNYVLATIHRPENTDAEHALKTIFGSLGKIATETGPVVLPLHPRTRQRLDHFGLTHLLSGISVIAPLAYEEFVALASLSGLLISDSGGVQEEASVWKRPVVVVRRSTERSEGLGTFSHMSGRGSDLVTLTAKLYAARAEIIAELERLPSPYGDVHAAERSVEALDRLIGL